jgi:hypothetical protein
MQSRDGVHWATDLQSGDGARARVSAAEIALVIQGVQDGFSPHCLIVALRMA